MQDIFFTANFHGVAGVVAALGTKDPVRFPRHHIQDFSLSLIPPLQPENNRDFGFQRFCPKRVKRS